MKEKLANNYLFLELTVFKIFKIHFAKNRLNRNITSAVYALAHLQQCFFKLLILFKG